MPDLRRPTDQTQSSDVPWLRSRGNSPASQVLSSFSSTLAMSVLRNTFRFDGGKDPSGASHLRRSAQRPAKRHGFCHFRRHHTGPIFECSGYSQRPMPILRANVRLTISSATTASQQNPRSKGSGSELQRLLLLPLRHSPLHLSFQHTKLNSSLQLKGWGRSADVQRAHCTSTGQKSRSRRCLILGGSSRTGAERVVA